MNDDLSATIGRMIQAARVDDASADIRSKLFDSFMSEPQGDEVTGRSQFISSDVADAIETLMPDLMEPFTATDRIVAFAPVGEEDEDAAEQETEVVNHIFWQKNPGFLTLYSWIKEGLIQQNSYVKSCWEEKTRITVEEYEDLAPEEFMQVMQGVGDDYEFLEQEGIRVEDDGGIFPELDEMGMPAPISVKLRCVKKAKEYVIRCIPQEEFFVTERWPSISLEGVPCCGHVRDMERGELRAMGFAEDSIKEATKATEDDEEWNRHDTRDHFSSDSDDDTGDDATQTVTVYEAYCRVDIDGDGRAELVKVWASGDGSNILKWEDGGDAIEEVSHHPFSAWTPFIVPHRHVGRSVAELIDDIQKVKSVLYRHTLDNLYFTNYARPTFDENQAGPNTYADLAKPDPGAPVRTGGAQIEWHMPPSVVGTTLPLIEKFDGIREERTGATRYNQGLDADSLNKTFGGIKEIRDMGSRKVKTMARVFAETGLRELFLRIHRDLRNGPMKEMVVKLRNQWTTVNPRAWRDRTDMTVHVGIGTGDRDMRRQGLMLIGQTQEKMMMAGMPHVGPEEVFNTMSDVAQTFGIKSVGAYMKNPATVPPPPPQQEQPDPAMMVVQAQIQKMQQDAQTAQAELARKTQEMEAKFAAEAEKRQQEFALKMREIEIKADAERRQAAKAAADIRTARERLDLDADKAVMADDLGRDKLEVDAATGYLRAQPARVDSVPPVDYDDV